MKTYYFIEQKYYSVTFLEKYFESEFIETLKKKKICIEVEKGKLSFHFVGMLNYLHNVYFIFPKYVKPSKTREDMERKAQLIINVIQKYASKPLVNHDQMDFLSDNLLNEEVSSFALSKFIIEDYLLNGFYTVSKEIIELNGDGEILWGETVDELNPTIINGSPYYFDVLTHNDLSDLNHLIIKVHQWVVNYCYELYKNWLGYSHIEIEPLDLDLEDLGAVDYLVNVIDRELNLTFIDHRIKLLKAIKAVLLNTSEHKMNQIDAYGTKYFEHIWEKICSELFDNKFKLYENSLPRPSWSSYPAGDIVEKDTFKPDVISTYKLEETEYFLILDAKYYNIRFDNGKVLGNPSVNDVAKQLLYEKGLQTESIGKKVRNYFLFPTDSNSKNTFDIFGKVTLDFISEEPVKLVYLSDERVYNRYLNNFIFTADDYNELEKKSFPDI
ncbi:LlaJI family restriction endonuclease [Rossellomorea aquimaris]|uniref:LlaJI family restriction endonuclease n=1 Tax=Rossellomorea aquimaris TaxID=189382 RepID=UPI001CD19939|nr:LlaJI family restriction endonuclease [Rossellomorea aquimaris]MCA1054312.1 LlaJI family restriction endonuclease [Rossellomorea aquimaris]